MGKSATQLGKDFCLNGQEMNQLLKNQGFLEGEPGAYWVTEKGLPFATETDLHRGTGGLQWYNKYWSERTWDPSIMDELEMSVKQQQAAIDAVADRRTIAAARKAVQEIADRNFQATGSAFVSPVEEASTDSFGSGDRQIASDIAVGAGIIAVVIGVGYGVYKAAPHVKRWWNEKAEPWLFG